MHLNLAYIIQVQLFFSPVLFLLFFFFLESSEDHFLTQRQPSPSFLENSKNEICSAGSRKVFSWVGKECAEGWLDDASVFQSAAYFNTPKTQLYLYV